MKIAKLIIGIVFLSSMVCNSYAQVLESKQDPTQGQNQSKSDGVGFPLRQGFINDFEDVFTSAQKNVLKEDCL